MRRARLIPLFVCAVLAAAPAEAQWQVTADAGVSHLRQTGIPESNALTLGVNLDLLADRTGFRSSFLAARTSADRWTAQGLAIGSLRSEDGQRHRWDLTGFVSTFGASNELPTLSTELMAQARQGGPEGGVALGVGAGAFSHNGGVAPLFHGQGDLWRTLDANQFVGELSVVGTSVAPLPDVSAAIRVFHPLSYADLSASWRRELTGVSLGVSAGVRAGINGVADADGWATADATAWLSSYTALVGSAGRTLDDAVRGVPATQFVSVAIRFAARPQASLAKRRAAVAGVSIAVVPIGDGRQRIEIQGVKGARVELMADFTNWNPVVLERDGNVWRTERAVSAGLHRIALRVDDGEWIAPANLPRVNDELGGVVGLITIP